MIITPDFIPHKSFHEGIWLLSEDNPVWYYFMGIRNNNIIRTKRFDNSADKPLQEIVQFLHTKGIITTPSCSGHEMPALTFKEIYELLIKDKYKIRKEGLILKDIESGDSYFYHDVLYDLPWTETRFVNNGMHYQLQGVLGMRLHGNIPLLKLILRIKVPGVEILEKNSVLLINMIPHPHFSNEERWELVTLEIKRLFHLFQSENIAA